MKHQWTDITDIRVDLRERRQCFNCGVISIKIGDPLQAWMRKGRSRWSLAGHCKKQDRFVRTLVQSFKS